MTDRQQRALFIELARIAAGWAADNGVRPYGLRLTPVGDLGIPVHDYGEPAIVGVDAGFSFDHPERGEFGIKLRLTDDLIRDTQLAATVPPMLDRGWRDLKRRKPAETEDRDDIEAARLALAESQGQLTLHDDFRRRKGLDGAATA